MIQRIQYVVRRAGRVYKKQYSFTIGLSTTDVVQKMVEFLNNRYETEKACVVPLNIKSAFNNG